jgi:hypothetical protein
MSETLSSLLKLLEQEHEIYCDLLKSSDSKRKAIVEEMSMSSIASSPKRRR